MTPRLLLSYLSITLFALVVLVFPLGYTFSTRERQRLYFDVEREAIAFSFLSEDALESDAIPDLGDIGQQYASETGSRVVIVDRFGISVLDTNDPGGPRRDFSTRPEFVLALQGKRDTGVRYSQDLGNEFLYSVVPVASGGTVHGAVRITYPTSTVDHQILEVWLQLGLLSAVVLGAVAAVGFVLAQSVTRPVRLLQEGARAVGRGDLAQRVPTDTGAPELRALAATFNHTTERLQRLVDGQRTFVADAAHQLRSPLTALRLRLETIDVDPGSGDQAKIEAAVAEVDRLSRLVNGLLVLARSVEAKPETSTVDLELVLSQRIEHWAPLCRAEGVELSLALDTATADLPIQAVPGTIDTMVDNLIDNALGMSPAGTGIQIRAQRLGHEVTVHVVDQGPGMTDEERARAFDRFWRAPGNQARRGSGLGLAIVADLAAANGGRAELLAAPGGGLDVKLTLASADAASSPAPSAGS